MIVAGEITMTALCDAMLVSFDPGNVTKCWLSTVVGGRDTLVAGAIAHGYATQRGWRASELEQHEQN